MSSRPRKQQRFRRSTIPGQLFKNRDIEFIQLTLQAIKGFALSAFVGFTQGFFSP